MPIEARILRILASDREGVDDLGREARLGAVLGRFEVVVDIQVSRYLRANKKLGQALESEQLGLGLFGKMVLEELSHIIFRPLGPSLLHS